MVRLIDVRVDERKKVINLFFQNFFDGLGTAFFYAMALFIFLNGADYHELLHLYPFVFLLSGIFILMAAPVYNFIENRSRTDYLIFGLGIFVLLLVLVSYFLLTGTVDTYTGIALLIAHQVIYYFRQTQFWGLTAISFDVLQSKRLFSIVSAGDLPAKFLGYVLIFKLLETGTIEPSQLIFFAAASYLVSFYFLNNVFRSDHSLKHGSHQHFYSHVEKINFFGNKLVRSLFFLGFFIIIVVFVVDYAFTKIVMHKIHDDDIDVYSLVSAILYSTYGIASILKIFVTGKVYQKLGLKKLMVLSPLLIIALISFTFLIGLNSADSNSYYSRMFIFVFIGFLVFRNVFEKPVFLSLFQPLSNKMRLKGHTLIKGAAEPLGLIFASGALIIYYQYFEEYNLELFGLVLIVPLLLWIFSAFNVTRVYANTLIDVINRKLLHGNSMLLFDENITSRVLGKLHSENESEVIFALSHIKNMDHAHDSYLHLLEDKSVTVCLAAWETLFDTRQTKDIIGLVPTYINEKTPTKVVDRVYYLLGKNVKSKENVDKLLTPPQPKKLEAFYAGWVENNDTPAIADFEKTIIEWLHNNDPDRKASALRLLKYASIPGGREILLESLESEQAIIKKGAIIGLSGNLDKEVFNRLKELLLHPEYGRLVHQEMVGSGDKVVSLIETAMTDNENKINLKFAQVLSQVYSYESCKVSVRLLSMENPIIRGKLLKGLQSADRKFLQDFTPRLSGSLDREVDLALEMIPLLHHHLTTAIAEAELQSVLQRIFALLALLYEKEVIKKAAEGFFSGNPVHRSNSIEAMNVHLSPPVFKRIQLLLEQIANPKPGSVLTRSQITDRFCNIHKKLNQWTVSVMLSSFSELKDQLGDELMGRNSPIIIEQLNVKEMNKTDNVKILERVLALKKTSLFGATEENVLIDIAMMATEIRLAPGVTLFRKGDKGTSMYIILSGTIRIHDGDHDLSLLHENDFFGELAMLETEFRSADASAHTDVLLLTINQDAIYEIMDDRPEVAKGIIRVLCQRIRALNEKFVGVQKTKAH